MAIIKKLASRKLWLALAGVVTGIALAFGADAGEINTIAGAVTAVLSVVSYIMTEGRIDAVSAGKAIETARKTGQITAQAPVEEEIQ